MRHPASVGWIALVDIRGSGDRGSQQRLMQGRAAMQQFDHILKWELKKGSHRFPGKRGGTCINEAAVVAAGFPYKPVRYVGQMPSCFSRPICHFAMQLNDSADDEERQLLLPYVARLACA